MDNNKYYNASLSYDFSMFEERPKRTTDSTVKKPEYQQKRKAEIYSMQKQKEKTSPVSVYKIVFKVLPYAAILISIVAAIFINSQINQINEEISDVKKEISEMEAEKIALECQYNRICSYENLETKAIELGMTRPTKDQIKYIRVNDKDTCVIPKK